MTGAGLLPKIRDRVPWRVRSQRLVVGVFAQHRGWLSFLISLIGVVGVALATHVIEDMFDVAPFGWLAFRLFVVTAVIGLLLISIRNSIAHRRGTLIYLRLLYEWMADLHDIALEARVRGQSEHKIAACWLSPVDAVDGVIDWSAEVTAITAEAARSFNEDTSETGTHLAPNLLWPAALAVGYDLAGLGSASVELVEFDPIERGDETGRGRRTRTKRPSPSMDWALHRDPKNRAVAMLSRPTVVWTRPVDLTEVKRVLLAVELTSEGRATQPQVRFDVFGRLAVYPDLGPQHAHDEQVGTQEAIDASARGDLLLAKATNPVEIDTDRLVGEPRARRAHRLSLSRARPRNQDGLRVDDAGFPLIDEAEFAARLTVVHPQTAAHQCWAAVRQALHLYPAATLMVMLRVPKTVAVAIGTLLATQDKNKGNPGCGVGGCRQESCRRPWSRLLLLNWDGSKYEVVRVHGSQPEVSDLAETYAAALR